MGLVEVLQILKSRTPLRWARTRARLREGSLRVFFIKTLLLYKNRLSSIRALIDGFNIKAVATATHSRKRARVRDQRSGVRFLK